MKWRCHEFIRTNKSGYSSKQQVDSIFHQLEAMLEIQWSSSDGTSACISASISPRTVFCGDFRKSITVTSFSVPRSYISWTTVLVPSYVGLYAHWTTHLSFPQCSPIQCIRLLSKSGIAMSIRVYHELAGALSKALSIKYLDSPVSLCFARLSNSSYFNRIFQ